LLAKGPLSVVLLVLSMLLWIAGSPKERLIITWQSLPWFRGTALTLLLALPWYLWAEHRTPGFLYHFIIGEHIERFLVKGWNGGRFAASHAESLGMIWWFFIESFVPWTLFVIPALFGLQKTKNALGQWRYRTTVALYFKNSEVQYLFSWILSSLLLFTLSRNILEAYVLPTLPAFAILFAAAIDKLVRNRPAWRWSMLLALGAPIVIMMVVLFFNDNLEKQSQRHLLRNWQKDTPLIYVGKVLPPSAIFYSNNQAQLKTALDEVTSHPVTVVMDGVSFDALPTATQAEWIMIERYDDFIMLHSHPK
jgi:4-amino-4-deoxy-L-arabinose transferase-like glycosyltransferase